MKKTVALIGMLLCGSPTIASEYITYGVGTSLCASWVDSRKANTYHSMGHWLQGYLTAAQAHTELSIKVDHEGLFSWIDRYCMENPTKTLGYAVESMVLGLRSKK